MFATLLVGILVFFVLEKLVLWRHCHIHDCEVHDGSVFPVLIGDAFHNFVDGAVIAAAVMTSVPLGVSTALAVAAHEIPQEVGDFAILLHAGYSRRRALLLNVMSGSRERWRRAWSRFVALQLVPVVLPYCLALAAASFLYVAMADLIPGLHRGRTDAHSLRQILLIAAGVATRVRLRPVRRALSVRRGDDSTRLCRKTHGDRVRAGKAFAGLPVEVRADGDALLHAAARHTVSHTPQPRRPPPQEEVTCGHGFSLQRRWCSRWRRRRRRSRRRCRFSAASSARC